MRHRPDILALDDDDTEQPRANQYQRIRAKLREPIFIYTTLGKSLVDTYCIFAAGVVVGLMIGSFFI